MADSVPPNGFPDPPVGSPWWAFWIAGFARWAGRRWDLFVRDIWDWFTGIFALVPGAIAAVQWYVESNPEKVGQLTDALSAGNRHLLVTTFSLLTTVCAIINWMKQEKGKS